MSDKQKPNRLRYSKDRVIDALRFTRGNVTEAAEMLGAGRATLNRYIKMYGIDVDGIGAMLDIETIRKGLELTYGNVELTAKHTGISRPTIYKYMRENPELEAWRDECEGRMLDIARGVVNKSILDGDLRGAMFLLRTKGGYRTSGDVTVKGDPNEPIKTVIEVVYVDKSAEVGDGDD